MQKRDNYSQFESVGINRAVSPILAKKGEWELIVNADIPRVGVVQKRLGYKKILDTPDASEILTLIPYEIGDAGKLIMINAAGKAYASSALTVGSGSWGSAIATGLNDVARWGWAVLNGNMFLGNGITAYKTDATAFSTVSGLPVGQAFTTLFQRLYVARVSASPSTLFWSNVGDGTNWSSVAPNDSSSTDIEKDWKGNIKNICFSNDRVVIYKDKIMKRWDTDYMKTIMDSRGITAPWSLADVEGLLASLDRDGIRIYDGSAPRDISEPIKEIIQGIDFSSTNRERICAVVYQQKYLLNVGDVTLPNGETISNAMIVYDYNFNTFVVYSLAHKMTAIAKLVKTDGTEKVYMGDVNGNVYEMFNGDTDDGTEIVMRAEDHIRYPYDGGYEIKPEVVTVVSENPDNINVKITPDFGDTIDLGNLEKPSQNILVGNNVESFNGFKISFYHAGKGRPAIYGWSMDYLVSDKLAQ